MSEPESTQPKPSKSLIELSRFFEGIATVANSQASEVAQADDLSLDEKKDLEVERQREGLQQTRRINKAQFGMLGCLFFLIVLWLLSVMALTMACGLRLWGFSLSDTVIVTYIASTTVSVLGLFRIAAGWLFSPRQPN